MAWESASESPGSDRQAGYSVQRYETRVSRFDFNSGWPVKTTESVPFPSRIPSISRFSLPSFFGMQIVRVTNDKVTGFWRFRIRSRRPSPCQRFYGSLTAGHPRLGAGMARYALPV
jgi:hypothetical protein